MLVRKARTGEVIATVRQSDSQFVNVYFYLAADHVGSDRRARLALEGSSPWIVTQDVAERAVEVVSVESTGTTERYRTLELMFGKPDDLPFIDQRLSYAEGAYLMDGSRFFNKFFRYGNNRSSFRLPLEADRPAWLRPGFNLSANALVTLNGREVAILEHSTGRRFSQDFYRFPVRPDGQPIQTMTISTVAPFRATPTNLRQMAFAFHSLEIATPRRPDDAPIRLIEGLNTRLDYRHRAQARAALLRPRDAIAELLACQGGAWLPDRDPIRLPEGARRRVDAVVLLDPVLEEIANTGYASGDVWVNSAVGAAMMLEHLGYSVAYGTPADLAGLQPAVVYVPSQPFYRNLLIRPVIDGLAASTATVIIEPSFSADFLNNALLHQAASLQFAEDALFIRRDAVRLGDRTASDAFQATPVIDHRSPDAMLEIEAAPQVEAALKIEASLAANGKALAFSRSFGRSRLKLLAFPAGYYYFNYGLRSHRAIVEHLLDGSPGPRVFARSASRVRAYLIRERRCAVDVMIENNNVGSFNYYGLAEVSTPHPSAVPPPVSRVELDGTLFAGERRWRLVGPQAYADGPLAGSMADRPSQAVTSQAVTSQTVKAPTLRPVLHGLAGDTVVTLQDEECVEAGEPGSRHAPPAG